MIEDILWSELEEVDVDVLYIQRNGATSNITQKNIALLQSKFRGRLISRNGDIKLST